MNAGPLLVGDHNIITGREYCAAYTDSFGRWNPGFYCPQSESKAAISCCGSTTYKYCCDTTAGNNGNGNGNGIHGTSSGGDGEHVLNSSSNSGEGSNGGGGDGAESLNAPFLVRFPILSGVVTGFLLVTIFVVIGSCYSNSCCIFSKRSYLSSGLLYQIVVRKSVAASNARSNAAARGRRRTRPIQSMVVCTAESHLPAMPFNVQQHELEQQQQSYGTDKSTNTNTSILLNESCGKSIAAATTGAAMSSAVITHGQGHGHGHGHGQDNSNFLLDSVGQSPARQSSTQHQSSAAAAAAGHNFQNISQALDNSVPLLARASANAGQLTRINNNDSPQTVNISGQQMIATGYNNATSCSNNNNNNAAAAVVVSARTISGPELLLHCPSETRSRPSSQNSNIGKSYSRNSYSYSTLPIMRGGNSCTMNSNNNSYSYYSTYEIANPHPPPQLTYVNSAVLYDLDQQNGYSYGPANIRPYSTLNFPRPRSNPSPSQLSGTSSAGHGGHVHGASGVGSGGNGRGSGSGRTQKSILKKPGSRPLFSPTPRYYISSSSHSAPEEDDDEEPDYYYVKQRISTTTTQPPDIIQTRHNASGIIGGGIIMPISVPPDRRDSPMSMSMSMNIQHQQQQQQLAQPQPQQVFNHVVAQQQSRSVQVQLQDKPAGAGAGAGAAAAARATLELEDQHSEMSEIEIDTFL